MSTPELIIRLSLVVFLSGVWGVCLLAIVAPPAHDKRAFTLGCATGLLFSTLATIILTLTLTRVV